MVSPFIKKNTIFQNPSKNLQFLSSSKQYLIEKSNGEFTRAYTNIPGQLMTEIKRAL